MSIFIDPETRQRVTFEKHSGDVSYFADVNTSTPAVYNESIIVLGPWADATGSGGPSSSQQLKFAGTENQLQGTEAEIEGHQHIGQLNEVGQNATAIRRRLRFINRTPEELTYNNQMQEHSQNGQ